MNAQHYKHDMLREIRERCGLTQVEVAGAVGVQRQTIIRAENGTVASYDLLCDLCELYKTRVIDILHPQRLAVAA